MGNQWQVSAVGTNSKGSATLWLYGPNMKEYEVPVSVLTMAKLAEAGLRIRNDKGC